MYWMSKKQITSWNELVKTGMYLKTRSSDSKTILNDFKAEKSQKE